MRRNIIAILLILSVAFISNAQVYQLPNGSFESWDGSNSDDEPSYWNAFPTAQCDLTGLASLGCGTATSTRHQKSNDNRLGTIGSYSCKLFATEISILGNTVIANGTITTGQIRIGSSTASNPENYNITRTSNTSLKQSFNAKPDSIVFWAKFACPSSTQKARISAIIHDNYDYRDPENSDAGASAHVVGKAINNFARDDQDWHRHSVAFDYNFSSNNPQYLLLTFTTNMVAGEGSENDFLYIDDIEFIYNTNLIGISSDGTLIEDFSNDIYSYYLNSECGNTPIITASPESENASINISQSVGSGPATVLVTNGDQSRTYTIYFNFINTTEISDEVCQGEIYTNNGFNLGIQAIPGTFFYQESYYESETCDSIINLSLIVNPTYISDTNYIMICETGEYNFHGSILTEPGTYETTLPSINGCDSTIIVNLIVGEFYRTYINESICEGDIYNQNGFNMNSAGTDTLIYTALNDCDSLVILNLNINPNNNIEIYDTISQGQTYNANGFEIFSTNIPDDYTFQNSFQNFYGCDSIIYLHLNITATPEDSTQAGNTELGFMLYPNPSSDQVIIKAEGTIDIELNFIIYDLFGKFISKGTIINDETFLNINNFAAGIYFIKIFSENGDSNAMKFIKN